MQLHRAKTLRVYLLLVTTLLSISWLLPGHGTKGELLSSLSSHQASRGLQEKKLQKEKEVEEEEACSASDGRSVPKWVCEQGWNPACGTPQRDQMESIPGANYPAPFEKAPGSNDAGNGKYSARYKSTDEPNQWSLLINPPILTDQTRLTFKRGREAADLYYGNKFEKYIGQAATLTELHTVTERGGASWRAWVGRIFSTTDNFFFDLRERDLWIEYVGGFWRFFSTHVDYTICGYVSEDLRVLSGFEVPDSELPWLVGTIYRAIIPTRKDSGRGFYMQHYNGEYVESNVATNLYYSILGPDFGQAFIDFCFCEWGDDELKEEWKDVEPTGRGMRSFQRECKRNQRRNVPRCYSRKSKEVRAQIPEDRLWQNGVENGT